jgi:uncharacterized membrane protein YeiH
MKMRIDAFAVMNIIGLLAFALVGTVKAIDADLDLLGAAILGVVTALGGGTTRDLLVNQVPNSLQSSTDVTIALVGIVLAVVGVHFIDELVDHNAVVVSDAVGLSAFATTGALIGHSNGVSPFGIIVLAMATGVGGGVYADILLRRIPFVLKEDFYATCTIIGGGSFWIFLSTGADSQTGAVACALTVFTVRLIAVHQEWNLPKPSHVTDI